MTSSPTSTRRWRSPEITSQRGPLWGALPRRGDVRLRLSAVIVSLQVLGQTVLGFRVSVAQILVSIGACVLVDVLISLAEHRTVLWPGSALLTGNSIAFILRADGTRHGDWWSLNGIWVFLLACAIAMASKHLIRVRGRHIYNPSNLGIVVCLLVVGVEHAYPQYLWWGPVGVPVAVALGVIALGAVWIVRPIGMLPMAVAFLLPFALLVAALSGDGQCFVASWSSDPVCGASYWTDIVASPETLVFVLFMMSDPRTTPASRWGRVGYGVATALVAFALLRAQPTEFGVKLSILASLTVVCTAVAVCRAAAGGAWRLGARRAAIPVLAAASAIAVAVPWQVTALAHDQRVLDVELGPVVPGGPSIQ